MKLFRLIPFKKPYQHIRARNIICGDKKQSISIFDIYHPNIIKFNYDLCFDLNTFQYKCSEKDNSHIYMYILQEKYTYEIIQNNDTELCWQWLF